MARHKVIDGPCTQDTADLLVPRDNGTAVAQLASRLGRVQSTFYGGLWDPTPRAADQVIDTAYSQLARAAAGLSLASLGYGLALPLWHARICGLIAYWPGARFVGHRMKGDVTWQCTLHRRIRPMYIRSA